MSKLKFPDNCMPGMAFNDFIAGHPMLTIYVPNSLSIDETPTDIILNLDDDGERMYLGRALSEHFRYMTYDVVKQEDAFKLNAYIDNHLRLIHATFTCREYISRDGFLQLSLSHTKGGGYRYKLGVVNDQR